MQTLLIDVWKRLTPWSKAADVYANDVDNAYPERMDRLINNSVTAKSAANIMVQYLLGGGYGQDIDSIVVNSEKKLKLIEFAEDIADDLVKQRGVFIHINYNANYNISSVSVLPYDWCRVGKKDSTDYNGKIAVSKEWPRAKRDKIKLIDVYNPSPAIIDAQVQNAGGWDNYKGQVLFVNCDTKFIYPLSRIDAVFNDCDSEAQAGIYKNRLLRRGFFGNTIVVTRPLVGNGLEGQELRNAESERESFQQAVKESLGAENSGGALCLEMDFAGEKLEDAILIKNIESNINDSLFSYTENSIRENILIAFNNLPSGLLKTADNSLFSSSGEAIKEMKRTYWENTTKERKKLSSILSLILTQMGKNISIEPIKLLEDATIDNA